MTHPNTYTHYVNQYNVVYPARLHASAVFPTKILSVRPSDACTVTKTKNPRELFACLTEHKWLLPSAVIEKIFGGIPQIEARKGPSGESAD